MRVPKLLSGFVVAFGLMLGATGIAHATNYTCDEGGNPPIGSLSGVVDVSESGDCTLTHDFSTTGNINISAGGAVNASGVSISSQGGALDITADGNVTTGDLSSAYGFTTITTSSGTITTGDISTNGVGGVILDAPGDIGVGTIDTHGGYGGDVRIFANQSGGGDVFTIGSGASTSGTKGIIASSTLSGPVNVVVQNAGGISVTDGSDINVNSTGSIAGTIILDALNGDITIGGGDLSASATGSTGGGRIILLGNHVTTSSETTIEASDSGTGTDHYVVISAAYLYYTGGLTVKSDGNNDPAGGVFFAPEGSQPYNAPTDPGSPVTVGTITASQNPLDISGTGTLTISANGTTNKVFFSGNALTYEGEDMNITANGSSDFVTFTRAGSGSGSNTLAFNGGAISIHSDSPGGENAGQVNFYEDGMTVDGPSFTVTAKGPSSGNGDAGTIGLYANSFSLDASTTALFNANGPSSGTGKGGTVTFFPGDGSITLGTKAGELQVLANGGSSGGDAGSIDVNPNPGDITIDTANAISASVPGSEGKGGSVTLIANYNLTITSSLSGATINVDGKGDQDGGDIVIWANGDLDIGTAAGSLALSAQNESGSGNGGSIEVAYLNNLSISGQIEAGAGSGGDGYGGTVNLHDNGTLSLTGSIDASGNGAGQGGTVTLNSYGTTIDDSTALITAIGGSSGDGGQVAIDNVGNFDVLGVIDVDPDGSGGCCAIAAAHTHIKPLTRSGFDGSVTLNTDLCQQRATSSTSSWPKSFWDCTDQTGFYQSPAAVAISNLSTTLRNKPNTSRIRIFVFNTEDDYNTYFGKSASAQSGETWEGDLNNIYSDVWLINPASGFSFSDTTLQETTIHELGHAFDHFFGQSNQSGNDTYNIFAQNDFLNLDYANVVPGSQSASTPRLPCALTPNPSGGYFPGAIPFANVVDANGIAICDGSVLSSTYSSYTSNHAIIQAAAVGQYWFTQHDALWNELYAQSLAFEAYAKGNSPSLYAYVVPDNVFTNGYYACTRAWADAIQAGGSTPPSSPASCSVAVPSWYTF